jgi:hypothetical protein
MLLINGHTQETKQEALSDVSKFPNPALTQHNITDKAAAKMKRV